MSRKSKGINLERELIHMFWATKKWVAARCAGSGSMRYPSPDIIASNGENILVIECKSNKKNYVYLTKNEVEDLTKFAEMFGAIPLVAVRFDRKGWYFIKIDDLDETEKNFAISLEKAMKKGMNFNDVLKTGSGATLQNKNLKS